MDQSSSSRERPSSCHRKLIRGGENFGKLFFAGPIYGGSVRAKCGICAPVLLSLGHLAAIIHTSQNNTIHSCCCRGWYSEIAHCGERWQLYIATRSRPAKVPHLATCSLMILCIIFRDITAVTESTSACAMRWF